MPTLLHAVCAKARIAVVSRMHGQPWPAPGCLSVREGLMSSMLSAEYLSAKKLQKPSTSTIACRLLQALTVLIGAGTSSSAGSCGTHHADSSGDTLPSAILVDGAGRVRAPAPGGRPRAQKPQSARSGRERRSARGGSAGRSPAPSPRLRRADPAATDSASGATGASQPGAGDMLWELAAGADAARRAACGAADGACQVPARCVGRAARCACSRSACQGAQFLLGQTATAVETAQTLGGALGPVPAPQDMPG